MGVPGVEYHVYVRTTFRCLLVYYITQQYYTTLNYTIQFNTIINYTIPYTTYPILTKQVNRSILYHTSLFLSVLFFMIYMKALIAAAIKNEIQIINYFRHKHCREKNVNSLLNNTESPPNSS